MASHASVPPRGAPPKAPDKGSFPLDHFRECSAAKESYMGCLRENAMQTADCRELSAQYLKCRMDTCARARPLRRARAPHPTAPAPRSRRSRLMAREDLSKLGYHEDSRPAAAVPQLSDSRASEAKRKGFVAGLGGIERGKPA